MRKPKDYQITCPNPDCRLHKKEGKNIIKKGVQKNGTQRYQCTCCKKTFAETKDTPFFRKHLKKEEIIRICKLFSERISFRGIARATNHHLDTIRDLATSIAKYCKDFNNYFIKDLGLDQIEVDEMWSFVKKNKKS